jgi:hypothetical protein
MVKSPNTVPTQPLELVEEVQGVITATASPKKETVVTSRKSSSYGLFQQQISTISIEKNFSKTHKNLFSTELYQFLVKYKVEKGQPMTHTSIGKPAGSYCIPFEEKDYLIDLLDETIFHMKIPVHLTEKPIQHTIIKVDLDFKFPLDENERKYTPKHVPWGDYVPPNIYFFVVYIIYVSFSGLSNYTS